MVPTIETIRTEELSNAMGHKVCRWISRKNRFPLTTSENKTEKKYAMWISRKKFYQKTGKYPLFISDIEISSEYGYDIFEMSSNEYSLINKIDKICMAYNKNPNNYPSCGSAEYGILSRMRKLDNTYIHSAIIDKFSEYNCMDLITKSKTEIFSNLTTRQICQTLEDKKEISDDMRRVLARRRNRLTPLFQSDIEIYRQNKQLNSLKPLGLLREEKSNSMCRRVCAWIERNSRFPSRSGGRIEARYNRWIWAKNMSLIGAGTTIFYESDRRIADSYGIKMFNIEEET